jgi:hypothetical protein
MSSIANDHKLSNAVSLSTVQKCKYCLMSGHTRKGCMHLTLDHDSSNCSVCKQKNNRFRKRRVETKKKVLWKHINWDSVFQGNETSPKMFMKSAFIRKNLILKYISKDCSIKTFTVSNLEDVQKIVTDHKNKIESWIIKPPEKSNAVGVRAFQDPVIELGHNYFSEQKNDNKNKDSNSNKNTEKRSIIIETKKVSNKIYVLQEYISPLLLDCCNNCKFHIRALVYFVGDLDIYICKEARVLVATKPWVPDSWNDEYIHITNQSVNKRCELYNMEKQNINLRKLVRNNQKDTGDESIYQLIFPQMIQLTKNLVKNLKESAPRKTFFPLHNTYELFGFDFTADKNYTVKLMEVNPDPSMELFATSMVGSNKFADVIASTNPLEWRKEKFKYDPNCSIKKGDVATTSIKELFLKISAYSSDHGN